MIKKIILTIIYFLICSCSTQPPTSIIGCMESNACNYNPNANDAGECDYIDCNDHPINSLWFNAKSDGIWGIGYNSNVQIGGFQMTINGSTIISVIDGDAQGNGFGLTINEASDFIIGFSASGNTIPPGDGELFSLELDGTPTAITNIVISDGSANSVIFVFDANYFSSNLDLEWTGNSHLTIFSASITNLEAGDEIGIFDSEGLLNYDDCTNQIGEILVGSGVWQGEQLEIINIGSIDMCSFGGVQLAGYVTSNPIIIKVWDSSEQVLKVGSPEYSSGSGIFSDIISSVSELSF